ncbi:hypothetical protein [Thermosynechococcus sp.]|uniref:hypothetical protein n=1 Tax=Thermosynechococcus sp. TaxID=2814275 RepID=UPI00262DB6C2|nr:hypothetical protein [Thermosynechococcus sp.]
MALALGGCGLFTATETEITDQKVTDQTAAPPPASPPAPKPTEPQTAGSVIAALTPPTNPKTYIQGLSDIGRTNPFAPVPLPGMGGIKSGNGAATPAAPGTKGTGTGSGSTGTTTGSGATRPAPPPPPVDAQAVQVLGIAAVDGRLQAIIRSPKENVTRTVQVGDTIAGNVIVRAIDAYNTTPTVVLEQFGQTVRLTVGQPTTAQGAASPAI